MERVKQKGKPRIKTRNEVVDKNMQDLDLNPDDAMDHGTRKTKIKG